MESIQYQKDSRLAVQDGSKLPSIVKWKLRKDGEKNEWSIARLSSRKSVVINYEIHPSVELRPIMATEFENFFLRPSICETSQTRRLQEDRKTAVKFYDRIGGKKNGEYVRIISFSRLVGVEGMSSEGMSRSFSKIWHVSMSR